VHNNLSSFIGSRSIPMKIFLEKIGEEDIRLRGHSSKRTFVYSVQTHLLLDLK
jgi:hypothetical protein